MYWTDSQTQTSRSRWGNKSRVSAWSRGCIDIRDRLHKLQHPLCNSPNQIHHDPCSAGISTPCLVLRSAVCTSTQRSTRPRSSFAFSTLKKKFLSSTAYLSPKHCRPFPPSWLSPSSINASIPLSSFRELTQSTQLRALLYRSVPGGRSPIPTFI